MKAMTRLLPLLLAVGLLLVPAAAAKAPGHYLLPGPGPGGEECVLSDSATLNMENKTYPGEIGLRTTITCNQKARIAGSQSLLQYWPWGWLLLANTTWLKTASDAYSLTMTSFYTCGSVTTLAVQDYKGVAVWNVLFNDGYQMTPNMQVNTPEIFTRCASPGLAQAY